MKISDTEPNQNESVKHTARNKSTYSCYYEFQLEQSDFGLSRKEHNAICNRALVIQLELLSKEGIQLVDWLTNEELLIKMKTRKKEAPDDLLTWEHCPSSAIVNGRLGVMRLVPKSQHTPGSEHWRAFHPGYRNRGGYHEWALPAGAPDEDHTKVGEKFNYESITVEELPQFFEQTVLSNCYNDFCKVYSRAQQLLTPTQITRILSRCYPMGKSNRHNTLLHKAVKNGHQPLINSLLKCGEPVHHLLMIKNHRGNTVVHNAAIHNRHHILKTFRKLGADLSVKNIREETVEDIVIRHNFTACMPYAKHITQPEEQHSSDEEQGGIAGSIKDPHMAYGKSGESRGGNVNRGLKPHPLTAKKGFATIEKNTSQGVNTEKKYVITPQEIKAIQKAQKALQERKNQKKFEQQIQRRQKNERQRLLQERFRQFENRHTVGQKSQQAQTGSQLRNQQQSDLVVRSKRNDSVKQNVQSQRFFSSQGNQRVANSSVFQSTVYQPKPPLNFFSQQRPQMQLVQGSHKQNAQPGHAQQKQQPKNILNKSVVQNHQRLQKDHQQRVLISIRPRPKQPNQQRAVLPKQQQVQQKTQQQSQQRTQQQVQQRVQQQAANQRAQQQAQQRAQQQGAQQRAQQQAQQRAQQQAQQRAQQQAAQQRAQQQAQQRAQQQAAQQRAQQAAQQAAQQRAQQQAAQQRAQQLVAQQRAQQQAQQRAQQQAAQQRSYQRK